MEFNDKKNSIRFISLTSSFAENHCLQTTQRTVFLHFASSFSFAAAILLSFAACANVEGLKSTNGNENRKSAYQTTPCFLCTFGTGQVP